MILFCLLSTVFAQILSGDFASDTNAAWSVASKNNEIYAGFADGSIKSYPRNISFKVGGHTEIVYRLLSSDTLFSASNDKTIKQWDYEGNLMRTYIGHTEAVVSLALSGTTLYSGSIDNSIRAWRTTDGASLSNFTDSGQVWGLAIDGDDLFSASSGKIARRWSKSTGKLLQTYIGHTEFVTAVLVYGTSLFTASKDTTIRQWDIASGKLMRTLLGHSSAVECLAITPTSLLSGSDDSTVIEWDLNNNLAKIRQYRVHSSNVYTIQTTQDPTLVLTASNDGSVLEWALTNMTPHIGDGNATDPSISMSPSNSLSVGVIFGIVIVCLVFLALCIVGFWVWSHRLPFKSSRISNPLNPKFNSDPIQLEAAHVPLDNLSLPTHAPLESLSVPFLTFSQCYLSPTELHVQTHTAIEQYSDQGQVRPYSMQESECRVQQRGSSQDRPYSVQDNQSSQAQSYSPSSVEGREPDQSRPHSVQVMEGLPGLQVEPVTFRGVFHPPTYDQAFLASLEFNHQK